MKNRLCVLMALLGLAFNASAASLGTAFTYQGRLNEGGAPANGLYDIRVSLYSHLTDEILADTAPNQNPYGIIGVGVTNGLFTTPLDFGPNAFNGPPRWLEIWVRTNFATFWTVLTPRQELKPAPYALYSPQAGVASYATNAGTVGNAPWAGLTGLPAGFADGVDNDTTYLAGFGLGLSGTTFSLNLVQTDARYWTTTGNAGTTPGTHFLGTTDDRALVFKVNNQTALRLEPTFASPNIIGGHAANVVTSISDGSAVLSGGTATDPNCVNGARSVLVGGHGNTNASAFSFLGGGAGNALIQANNSVLVGGSLNRVSDGTHGFLGGGEQNNLSGVYATVGGGRFNTNAGDSTTMGGGADNTIQALAFISTIGGGGGNTIQMNAAGATIGGGSGNTIQTNANFTTIGGGFFNTISRLAQWTTISGGSANSIQTNSDYSSIGGGENNSIHYRNRGSTIAGGISNEMDHDAGSSTIAGGYGNQIGSGARYSAIGGGSDNEIKNEDDFASPGGSTIAGGRNNNIGRHAGGSTIGGGANNVIERGSVRSTIAGGSGNYIDDNGFGHSSIGGGQGNSVIGISPYSVIGGGLGNRAQPEAAMVGGGELNTVLARADYGTIAGGRNNTIQTNAATAAIPGGRNAEARSYGQHVFASGSIRYDQKGDSQASLYVLRARTTNNIQGDLLLDWDDNYPNSGNQEAIRVPEGSVWTFRLQASALQDSGTELASYEASGVVTHLAGVIVLRLFDGAGNTITTAKPLLETAGAVPWQVTPYVNGTGADARLRIAVNGAPGQGNIRWVASVYSTELMR